MRSKEQEVERLAQMLTLERGLYAKGYKAVAGMDEAGRGPLAGPVVAACVVMPVSEPIEWVNDSKKLSPGRREKLYDQIMHSAVSVGVGMADHTEIDDTNILIAARRAFERAYAKACIADYVLMDYIEGVNIDVPVQRIVRGDSSVYSIAAASIIAKVERDRIMKEMHEMYPEYGFDKHKGYGTAQHREAILQHGPCPHHRMSFLTRILSGG